MIQLPYVLTPYTTTSAGKEGVALKPRPLYVIVYYIAVISLSLSLSLSSFLCLYCVRFHLYRRCAPCIRDVDMHDVFHANECPTLETYQYKTRKYIVLADCDIECTINPT